LLKALLLLLLFQLSVDGGDPPWLVGGWWWNRRSKSRPRRLNGENPIKVHLEVPKTSVLYQRKTYYTRLDGSRETVFHRALLSGQPHIVCQTNLPFSIQFSMTDNFPSNDSVKTCLFPHL
jgi:hypothetical protein